LKTEKHKSYQWIIYNSGTASQKSPEKGESGGFG